MTSKLAPASSKVKLNSVPRTQWPILRLINSTKGIKGGKLTLEKAKAMVLFSLNSTAKKMTIKVWNPHRGDKPISTPSAMESAFFSWESLLPRKSSWKNLLTPFFLFSELNRVEKYIKG